jgi:RNA polymerase sigma-19 factor, ECF subfamily
MSSFEKVKISQLVNKIKIGDTYAFKEFFNLTQPQIFHFLLRYTFDKDSAKDLLQETYIKFWNAREGVNPFGEPKAYLFKIASNLALNFVERNKKAPSIDDPSFTEFNALITDDLDYSFIMDDFKKALFNLSERCRVVFILRRYHDLKNAEIAEMLDISNQTVKNHMTKALTDLRKSLKSYLI